MTRDEANAAFVETFQRAAGLPVDGWAGARTLAKLGELLPIPALPTPPGLETFRGDLLRVHRWEGHRGRPYWPGGASGVTLDPGFDLGYQDAASLAEHYGFLGRDVLDLLTSHVLGIRGSRAKAAATHPEVRAIRITEAQALRVMPAIAARYWREIVKRFPILAWEKTPAAVQTALLSLAYNRGAGNDELTPLAGPLALGDWGTVSDLIARMQQDHKLAGVRTRRRQEAKLIMAGIDEERRA